VGSNPTPSSMKQCEKCGFTYDWFPPSGYKMHNGFHTALRGWCAYCGCQATKGGEVILPVWWEPVFVQQ
jgi:hypothetical protein